MHEFQCGHQECSSTLASSDKNYLQVQIADHLRDKHNVQTPTETLMTYLLTTCVTTS
jgi:predicted small metal-binding protein